MSQAKDLIFIGGDDLRRFWSQIVPLIEQARTKSKCADPFIPEDVYHWCLTGGVYCYAAIEDDAIQGVMLLKPENNYGQLNVHVWLGTFNAPAKMADYVEFVENLARKIGAVNITCNSPRPFDRAWPGAKEVAKMFRKEL